MGNNKNAFTKKYYDGTFVGNTKFKMNDDISIWFDWPSPTIALYSKYSVDSWLCGQDPKVHTMAVMPMQQLSTWRYHTFQSQVLLRIPDDKMRKSHKECTKTAEKASPSGKNKLKVCVSWEQVVYSRVPPIPTISTGVQVSSSACDSNILRGCQSCPKNYLTSNFLLCKIRLILQNKIWLVKSQKTCDNNSNF